MPMCACLLVVLFALVTTAHGATVRELQERVAAEPQNTSARFELARAYLSSGMSAEAVAAWQELAKSVPKGADAHYGYGLALMSSDRFDDALAAFGEAIRLDARRAEFYQAESSTYVSLYRYQDALDSLAQARSLSPDSPVVAFQTGKVKSQLGRMEEALADYDHAKELQYDAVACDFERGYLLMRLNRREESLTALDSALRGDPTHLGARYVRSQLRRRLGDTAGADEDLAIHTVLTKQQKSIDELKAAILRYESPKERAPIWANLGRLHLRYGDARAAIDAYEAALALDPELVIAHIGLGASRAANDELSAAEKAASEALRLQPDAAAAQALLGEIAYRRGDAKRAIALLAPALESDPSLGSARQTYAEALLVQRNAGAVAQYRLVVESDPDDAAGHDGLARALAQVGGDLPGAHAVALRAVELAPTVPPYRNTLALIAFRLGKLDEAEQALRSALELNPGNPNYRAGIDAIRQARAEAGK